MGKKIAYVFSLFIDRIPDRYASIIFAEKTFSIRLENNSYTRIPICVACVCVWGGEGPLNARLTLLKQDYLGLTACHLLAI